MAGRQQQHTELNSNEEQHRLPSKRRGSPHEAGVEGTTKKRQVESDIDPKGKSIVEHQMGKGILKVGKDTKIVTVNFGQGFLEADMDTGVVKIGIGEKITKFNVGEGKVIEEEPSAEKPVEEKSIEEDDTWEEASAVDFSLNDGIIRARFKPYNFSC